mgnify:CR=1 FL=1
MPPSPIADIPLFLLDVTTLEQRVTALIARSPGGINPRERAGPDEDNGLGLADNAKAMPVIRANWCPHGPDRGTLFGPL